MKPFDWKCGCTKGRNIPQKGVSSMKKASKKVAAKAVKKAVKKKGYK